MAKQLKIQKFFNKPLLKKKKLIQYFSRIDVIIDNMLKQMVESSDFITPEFMKFYMKIANGDARFRHFFEKKNRSRKNLKSKMRGGFVPEDKKFLLDTFFLLKSLVNKDLDVLDCKFNRLVKHTIVFDFLKIGEMYVKYSEEVAKNHYDNLHILDKIESELHSKNSGLYGLIRMLDHDYKKFLAIREKIMMPYMRYVYSLAAKLSSANITHQKEENFQAGVTGLFTAILMYDVNSSTFGNYAQFWIRREIIENLYSSCLIRIPDHNWQLYSKLEKMRSNAKDLDDLSKKSKISKGQINLIYERVILSQVHSLEWKTDDELEDQENYLDELHFTQEETDDLYFLKALNQQEKFIIGLLYSQYHIIENTLSDQDMISERQRQLDNVN